VNTIADIDAYYSFFTRIVDGAIAIGEHRRQSTIGIVRKLLDEAVDCRSAVICSGDLLARG